MISALVVVLASDGKALANAPLTAILEDGGDAADLLGGAGGGGHATETTTLEEEKPVLAKRTKSLGIGTTKALEVVSKEDRVIGVVAFRTWFAFIGAGGATLTAVVFGMFLLGEGSLMYADLLVLRWADREHQRTSSDIYIRYASFVGTATIVGGLQGVVLFVATLKAATNLHSRALRKVLYAPMAWIQANPFGRVINRFSADVAQIDDLLSRNLFEFTMYLLATAAPFACAVAVFPFLVAALPVIGYIVVKLMRYVTATMNALKRLDGITRSDVLSVVAASLRGLSPIRALKAEDVQTSAFLTALDMHARVYFFWQVANRFLAAAIDSTMTVFICTLLGLAIGLRNTTDPTLLAVALVYSLQLLISVQVGVRRFASTEQYLTSVERLLAYANGITPESTLKENDEKRKTPVQKIKEFTKKMSRELSRSMSSLWSDIEKGVVDDEEPWPSEGKIDVVQLKYRYRIVAPLVLKGITVTFPPRKKTGLCGRTGSGKSSTLAALARLHDVCGGKVLIDGVDVATLPLSELRAAIAVIPQQPSLFSGTVRFNVDPLGQRSDSAILAALREARLMRKLKKSSSPSAILDTPVEEGGHNWSIGESQLLCLARALVLKRRICCFDEYVLLFFSSYGFVGLPRTSILKRTPTSKRHCVQPTPSLQRPS